MTRTGADAVAYANGRIGENVVPPGYCLVFTRECFDVPAYYASAIDAWNAARWRHPGDRHPPPAVPLFFTSASIYDHVCFGSDPSRDTVTTFNDDVRPMDIASMEQSFGPYLGWTEDVNTVRVWAPTPDPLPVEVPEDDRMELVRITDDGRIMALGTYQWAQVPTMDDYNALAQVWGAYTDVNIHDAQRLNDQVNRNITDLAHSLAVNTPAPTTAVTWPAHLALLLALALLVGLVVALVLDARDGVISGAGVLVGGIISLTLAVARRSSSRHA